MKFIVNYKIGDKDKRPWGMWETTAVGHLDTQASGLAYCDKVITVNLGCKLSIQKHEFRQEYWVVMDGTATVYLGDTPDQLQEHHLKPGESIHVSLGVWHSIANAGDMPMVFSERQSGIYLDEEDILRYPTTSDPRMTNEESMRRIRAEVQRHGLEWPLPTAY